MSGNGIADRSRSARSLSGAAHLGDAWRASNNLEKMPRGDAFSGASLGLTRGSCSEVGVMIGWKSRMTSPQVGLNDQQRYLIEGRGTNGEVDRHC